jgi:hypothetical protein
MTEPQVRGEIKMEQQEERKQTITKLFLAAQSGDKIAQRDIQKLKKMGHGDEIDAIRKEQVWKILLERTEMGDENALNDLAKLIRLGVTNREVGESLGRLFASRNASRKQKQIIWSLRDCVIYTYKDTETIDMGSTAPDESGESIHMGYVTSEYTVEVKLSTFFPSVETIKKLMRD